MRASGQKLVKFYTHTHTHTHTHTQTHTHKHTHSHTHVAKLVVEMTLSFADRCRTYESPSLRRDWDYNFTANCKTCVVT